MVEKPLSAAERQRRRRARRRAGAQLVRVELTREAIKALVADGWADNPNDADELGAIVGDMILCWAQARLTPPKAVAA